MQYTNSEASSFHVLLLQLFVNFLTKYMHKASKELPVLLFPDPFHCRQLHAVVLYFYVLLLMGLVALLSV